MSAAAVALCLLLGILALLGLVLLAATLWDWLTYSGPGRSAADPDKETPPRGWQPPRRLGCVLLLLGAAAGLRAVDLDAYALGASYHAEEGDRARLSGWNPGAGLGLSLPLAPWLDATAAGIVYRDSYRRRATVAGAGARLIAGQRTGAHASLALLAAYLDGSDHAGPLPLPVVGIGWGAVHIETTADPVQSVVGAWLRVGVRL